jgi:hypothetical protein
MTADDQTGPAEASLQLFQRSRRRLRKVARRLLWTVARPYARRRAREAEMAGILGRLQADFDHARERHDEQIERLEDLVRELILTTESLRRSTLTAPEDRGGE